MRLLLSLLLLVVVINCKTKDEWKSRSVYQLLTDRFATSQGKSTSCNLGNYCGGDYKGMIQQLDYIQNLGFDAIWITPVVDNYNGGYHGYWARNMYDVNHNFGSADDLKALVNACHQRDIWVMVDVVANHMGNTNLDFSQNYPFNQSSHYHDWCDITDNDFNSHNLYNIERCRLAGLADLNQDNQFVTEQLTQWIRWLVQEFKFDGIRIDTLMMVKTDFWYKFSSAAGVYTVGEVFDGDMNFLRQFVGPVDALLNYPLFYTARDVFLHWRDMNTFENYYNSLMNSWGKQNIQYAGNFNDNHDNARFLNDQVQGYIPDEVFLSDKPHLTFSALKKLQFKAITAFCLTSVGIPMIYYGSEQLYAGGNDPQNREVLWGNLDQQSEMYKFIQAINFARKSTNAGNQEQIQRYSDSEIYAFTRGTLFAAFSSKYDRQVVKTITYHPYSEGTTICNIFYPTSDCIKITNGKFTLYLNYGEVKIFIPK
ncbi:unnamed protein product [Paramecium sonneborni]|uniref:alpha-amylase n=1 Tax=Paramecium sonneborni TaxID=65129 RepID=A0A8S1NDQ0_9CILI|nr:unnamed protein product [Paramecium sonneborni]